MLDNSSPPRRFISLFAHMTFIVNKQYPDYFINIVDVDDCSASAVFFTLLATSDHKLVFQYTLHIIFSFVDRSLCLAALY